MGIIPLAAPKASIIFLAAEHPAYNFFFAHDLQLPDQVEGCEAPVDPAHAEMFAGIVLERFLVLQMKTSSRVETPVPEPLQAHISSATSCLNDGVRPHRFKGLNEISMLGDQQCAAVTKLGWRH